MELDDALKREVEEMVRRDATLLDRRQWDDWIALFTEDAVFWAPAWANEEETTDDPETQLNLLYLRNRGHIEDRIFRIESRDSYASVPLDRTVHVVGNVLVEGVEGEEVSAVASALIHSYGKKGGQTRASLYDYRLRRTADGLRIARKKVTFIDERLEGPVDVYHM